MPLFDERDWRLEIDGLVERPVSLTYDAAARAPARTAGDRLPLRDRLVGPEGALGGCPLRRPARARTADAEREGDPLRLDGESLRRLAHAANRHCCPNVMLAYELDGKPLSRPHGCSRPRRDPRDVRLQGREVADPDGARRPPADGLLGRTSATTRTRGSDGRMAITPERRRLPRFGRTERAVHWVHATAFLILSEPGSASISRASRSSSAGGRC